MNFPHYRAYIEQRQQANNAIMALLAGSRLADHTLQLTAGSEKLLADIFPAVSHIRRFNLKTEYARELLVAADSHLGAITVPYALAIHEDFVTTILEWIKGLGIVLDTRRKQIKAWNMHEIFYRSLSLPEPTLVLELFHLLRHTRNAQIHAGSTVGPDLKKYVDNMTTAAQTEWKRISGRDPGDMIKTGTVTCASGEIFASFAVMKRLGRELNHALQKASINKKEWAKVAVHDFGTVAEKTRNSDPWMRALYGYARMHYGPLNITQADLEEAAITEGFWTRGKNVVPERRSKRKHKSK